jgi:hypothetical protein
VTKLAAVGNDEISENTAGRVANKGMENLAISPDGDTLFGAMQSPLIQDGGTNGGYTRILRIDLRTGKTSQFAYPLTNLGTDAKPNYPTSLPMSRVIGISSPHGRPHPLAESQSDTKERKTVQSSTSPGSVCLLRSVFTAACLPRFEIDQRPWGATQAAPRIAVRVDRRGC